MKMSKGILKRVFVLCVCLSVIASCGITVHAASIEGHDSTSGSIANATASGFLLVANETATANTSYSRNESTIYVTVYNYYYLNTTHYVTSASNNTTGAGGTSASAAKKRGGAEVEAAKGEHKVVVSSASSGTFTWSDTTELGIIPSGSVVAE